MRVVIPFLTFAMVACSAYAWSELRAQRAHQAQWVAQTPPEVEPPSIPVETPRAESPQQPASTWRGQLPFGGVPGADTSTDDGNAVTDELVPSPDEPDEIIVHEPTIPEALDEVIIDGRTDEERSYRRLEITPGHTLIDAEGRRISLERSEIIIY